MIHYKVPAIQTRMSGNYILFHAHRPSKVSIPTGKKEKRNALCCSWLTMMQYMPLCLPLGSWVHAIIQQILNKKHKLEYNDWLISDGKGGASEENYEQELNWKFEPASTSLSYLVCFEEDALQPHRGGSILLSWRFSGDWLGVLRSLWCSLACPSTMVFGNWYLSHCTLCIDCCQKRGYSIWWCIEEDLIKFLASLKFCRIVLCFDKFSCLWKPPQRIIKLFNLFWLRARPDLPPICLLTCVNMEPTVQYLTSYEHYYQYRSSWAFS